ncbi:MAG TPA: helix-turn-helix domain-containing protein [Pyrinomonadaceae bacterium]
MAELLRAAKLKKEQEEQEFAIPPPTIVPDTIPNDTIPDNTIVSSTIPNDTIPRPTIPKPTIPRPTIVRKVRSKPAKSSVPVTPAPEIEQRGVFVDSSKGYFQYLNDLSDRVIPELELKPFEQVVLNRLYRLSRGWKSEECTVGLGALANQCVMSRSSVQKSIVILVEKGLIEDLGEDKRGGQEGKRYRVLPGMTIPSPTIPAGTIVGDESTIVPHTTVVRGTIVPRTTIKDNNKEFKDTHTNTPGVGVGSRFTIEECRQYAKHLQSTGQGINNPGGYATTIHRTGEADMLIESFLYPEAGDPSTNPDTSRCPDCNGTGFYYPEGVEGGVARCRHERLGEEEGK